MEKPLNSSEAENIMKRNVVHTYFRFFAYFTSKRIVSIPDRDLFAPDNVVLHAGQEPIFP